MNSQKLFYVDVLAVISSFSVVILHANGIFWKHPYFIDTSSIYYRTFGAVLIFIITVFTVKILQ